MKLRDSVDLETIGQDSNWKFKPDGDAHWLKWKIWECSLDYVISLCCLVNYNFLEGLVYGMHCSFSHKGINWENILIVLFQVLMFSEEMRKNYFSLSKSSGYREWWWFLEASAQTLWLDLWGLVLSLSQIYTSQSE